MNLVTFAPGFEARLDPTLRKKSDGENASVSDCLTGIPQRKNCLPVLHFVPTWKRHFARFFFLNAPSTCQHPKTCQRGFKSYTPHSYDSWDWPTNWNKTLQMMNPMAECNKIIKTRKRTGLRLFWKFYSFPTCILVLSCERIPQLSRRADLECTLVCPPSFFVLRFCW